jgi:hypothetical protein
VPVAGQACALCDDQEGRPSGYNAVRNPRPSLACPSVQVCDPGQAGTEKATLILGYALADPLEEFHWEETIALSVAAPFVLAMVWLLARTISSHHSINLQEAQRRGHHQQHRRRHPMRNAITVRMTEEMIAKIDAIIARQGGYVSRQEVFRRLVAYAFENVSKLPEFGRICAVAGQVDR